MVTEKEFNLLTEPWIRVFTSEGKVEEHNLTDVLIHSHKYLRLAGETPVQDVAILRLLLAVMQTVAYRYDEDGNRILPDSPEEALGRWGSIWQAGKLPEREIREYLEKWEERFWLFHVEFPFYQVPYVEKPKDTSKDKPKGRDPEKWTEYKASKLNGEILESNHKQRLFANRSGAKKEALEFAEAARWLVYISAFDDVAVKSGSGVAWPGKLGLTYSFGDNLFETIMLNLVLTRERSIWSAPRPVWERKRTETTKKNEVPVPENQAELLSFQSRQIFLLREGDCVTGFMMKGGDHFEELNADIEQMTAWIRVEEKGKQPYHKARKYTDAQVWRILSCIIPAADSTTWKPGVVVWTSLLKKKHYLDKKRVIHFHTLSVDYGEHSSAVVDTYGDYLDVCPSILLEAGNQYMNMVQHEVEICEKLATCFFRLAIHVAMAAGNESRDIQSKAKDLRFASGDIMGDQKYKKYNRNSIGIYEKEQFYNRIDIPFRRWLLSIDPEQDTDLNALKSIWRRDVYRIARNYAEEIFHQAGEQAFVGHKYVDENKKETYYTSIEAFNYFCYKLNKYIEPEVLKEE